MEFGYSGNNLINTNEYVFGSFRSAFFFSANGNSLDKGRVVAYDLLSMTYEYPVGSGSIKIPLIRGLPIPDYDLLPNCSLSGNCECHYLSKWAD